MMLLCVVMEVKFYEPTLLSDNIVSVVEQTESCIVSFNREVTKILLCTFHIRISLHVCKRPIT